MLVCECFLTIPKIEKRILKILSMFRFLIVSNQIQYCVGQEGIICGKTSTNKAERGFGLLA